ncbi:MAG: ATP-binding protein [Betaproteobacteria bacterium]
MSVQPPGRVEVRPEQRQLLIDGQPADVGARAFDVLEALLARRERVVSKDELLDLVWPGVVVEENNLQVQVSALRKVLGRDAIATIPGRGYRLTLRSDVIAGGDAAPASDAAGARAPAADTRGNLPLLVEPPIGRDTELAALRALVGRCRLVSIVGPGGIGKSTVATALADALRSDFADGVWWVELAALTDGDRIAETVARAIGVQLAAHRPPAPALAAALDGMNALIVLDNCEHLAGAVTSLVDALLAHVPTLRVVVTSQEPLRTPYEHVFRLDSLATPGPDERPGHADALGFAAVRLFVERAKAADRRFELAASSADAVVEICRRLDGIPLAIELAAVRVPLIGAEGLRQRLDQRFRLLTAGARSVLRRHQTLRATLEWSHGLLSADEQAVFRRLGVFSGGTSLSMAQAGVADDTLDAWAVLSALGTLVDKSLVVADGGDEPRYRLLETPRAFALEQLVAAGETTEWTRRHALAVLAMLRDRASDRDLNNFDPKLALELDNTRAAIDWALGEEGDPAKAVELVAYSFPVWTSTAGTDEGLSLAARAVPLLGPTTPPSVAARFWLTYARLGLFSTRSDCFDAAQRAADLTRTLGDSETLYEALLFRAGLGARRSEFAAAHAAVAEAARIEDPKWIPRRRALRAFAEWILALREGRYEDARAHAMRQADLNRASGSARGEQIALGNVAVSDLLGGQPEAAARQLRAVIAELDRLGAGHAAGHSVMNLAYALLDLGDVEQALATARRAYALLRREGDHALMLPLLARMAAARGDHHTALKIAGYTLALWSAIGLRDRVGLSDAELAPQVAAEQREALMADGASLTEEQAFHLVLGMNDGARAA